MDLAALESLIEESVPKVPAPNWREELAHSVRGEIKFDEPLKRYTSLQIGGPADAFVTPADLDDLLAVTKFARDKRVPWTVLGLGSNVLIKDGGIRGIVLRLNKTFPKLEILDETAEEALIFAESGAPLPKLVELGRQRGFAGMENFYGIPGSVGGAIRMNAGTRDGEMKDHLVEIRVLNSQGEVMTIPRSKLKFEYRHLHLPVKDVILSGTFKLKKTDPAEVQAKVAGYQKRRQETQPLDYPNLGSVFKNPPKGFAAQMIEELGLKGIRVGGARISPKHANFIINEDQATAKDVLILIGLIKDKVKDELQIGLELEAKVLGEDESV